MYHVDWYSYQKLKEIIVVNEQVSTLVTEKNSLVQTKFLQTYRTEVE